MERMGNKISATNSLADEPAIALKKFRDPLYEYLLSGLEMENKWIKVLSLDTLGAVGDIRAISAIRPLLVDEDPDIRLIAGRVFARISDGRNGQTVQPQGNCSSCLIRLVADEALRRKRDSLDPCSRTMMK